MTNTAEYFDELARTWDNEKHAPGIMQDMFARLAGVTEGSRVLDLGCGTGIMEPACLACGAKEIVALDVAPGMIERARTKFAAEPRVRFECRDTLAYTDDGLFDTIIIYNAYPHFLDKSALVRKAMTLLQPEGRFLVAHGMGRVTMNAHHATVPPEVTSELHAASVEARIWQTHFAIDVEIDTPFLYCFGGVLRH